MKFILPPEISALFAARNALKAIYADSGLSFTFDGNLVGDLGEAVAAQMFGLRLSGPGCEGFDGIAPDKRKVQIKASGTKRGAVFRQIETCADHLLFFHFDYEACAGELVDDGPESLVRECLPKQKWVGQRPVSVSTLRRLNSEIPDHDRLPIIAGEQRA